MIWSVSVSDTCVAPWERPRARRDICRVSARDGTVIGGAPVGRLLALDEVSTIVWDALDGTTTVAELAEDLAAATGASFEEHLEQISWLVKALRTDGFLEDSTLPESQHLTGCPMLPPGSCRGKRIGIGRMIFAELEADGGRVAVGSTVPAPIDLLAEHLPVQRWLTPTTPPNAWYYLRVSPGYGQAARLQQLFGTEGDLLYAGFSVEEAVDACVRSVAGRLQSFASGGWLEGPALLADDAVVLVHPSMAGTVFHRIRPELEKTGITMVPSGVLEVDGLSVRAAQLGTGSAPTWPLRAVLLPAARTHTLAVRRMLDLFCLHDQRSFDAACRIVHTIDTYDVDLVGRLDEIVRQVHLVVVG